MELSVVMCPSNAQVEAIIPGFVGGIEESRGAGGEVQTSVFIREAERSSGGWRRLSACCTCGEDS